VLVTTNGTDMPNGQRDGDDLSVKPHEPCTLRLTVAKYAFSGGGGATNLVGRHLQFGRDRDERCWVRWNAIAPPIVP
jgi:hypothetical protein